MSGDSSAQLGMPDIDLLNILKIMCEVGGDQQADRKFESQTIGSPNSPSYKANKGQQIKTDNIDVNDVNSNISDFFSG